MDDVILTFLSHLDFWDWFALAAGLGILELLSGTVYLLWIAGAAALTGVIAWLFPSVNGHMQSLLFALSAVVAVMGVRRYLKHRQLTPSDRPHLNRRGRQYVGRTFVLSEAIKNGRGRVRVDDTLWRVQGQDAPVGSVVRIVDVDGVVLLAEPAANDDQEA